MNQTQRRWWAALKRFLGLAYLTIVAILLVILARDLDWSGVFAALIGLSPGLVVTALLLAAMSHIVYSGFDLIGRRYTDHKLSRHRVMLVTFVSYVANLNFGALVGAIGVRQRLYSRSDLPLITIAQVVGLSMATNWLGYMLLAAILLVGPTYAAIDSEYLPGNAVARVIGLALLAVVIGYVVTCLRRGGQRCSIGPLSFRVPGLPMALAQLALSTLNWLLIALIIYALLNGDVRFDKMLLTLLVAAIAGVITHIPGGLGVIEASFILMLQGWVTTEELLGALLAYRAIYYLLPLLAAGLVWIHLESKPERI